ncbi:2,3-diphosphoglycerate-dependent phosphoglycerate mutase [Candidatus Saccharibacteria bacterium]|jgi:2,3-bisphosphoglycerate-dependent phosphoglycerate mutase|nr:2,3-diphosphoglycerate-dependent phosphoglycerate mutase [Candidatus Saccharibacteria bacterium]MBP9489692.1 2,3-diphosphoglycerate-dependent phosphoglycerate mutase [Candidatus Saccharibacteria bacterium]MBP9552424.1 2,3-diphosphoglycerate-dependent phosphoglycerate mutase [Candidatus Saccharibacteria bacterium]
MDKNTTKLVISRHSESEWNLTGQWTGFTDVNLTPKGHADAQVIGRMLAGYRFENGYVSLLKRAQQTMFSILGENNSTNAPEITFAGEINERDYGDLTGKNKWEVKEEIGEEAFNGIRRGWDYPVPGGETLKDVSSRVVPYFENEMLPKLKQGQNILMAAHGNSIRALMKYLDNVADEDVAKVEMGFGQVLVYEFNNDGEIISREVLQAEVEPTHA